MAEARPIIQHFNLQHKNLLPNVQIWQNEQFAITVTGVGKVRAAAVTGIVCSTLTESVEAMVNIGIAGATIDAKKGDLFVINKISDAHSGNTYYPDMAMQTGLQETGLKTYDHPVQKEHLNGTAYNGLIDMEGAGFFEAAGMYLSTSRISCLKIVSDFLEGQLLDKKEIEEFIRSNTQAIEFYLNKYRRILNDDCNIAFSREESELFNAITGRLNLTTTQQRQLKKTALYRKIKSGNLPSIFQPFTRVSVDSKEERNKYFNSLKNELMG